eukprot:468014_1
MIQPLHLILLIALVISSINAKVISVYPCVWRDEATGAQLDLQFLKSMVLFNRSYPYYNGNLSYSPCANDIKYNDESYMVIASANSEIMQPFVKWDNGVTVPTYDQLTGNWYFYYSDTNIECLSNHSQQTTLNITWSYGDINNVNSLNPNTTFNNYNGQCSFHFTAQAVSVYNDSCVIPFYGNYNGQPYISGHVNISVFNSYVFNAKIGYFSNMQMFYSPCNDAIKCDNNLAQAALTDLNQTNCTYLSLYTGYGAAYSHTTMRQYSYIHYWNYNQYYDLNTNIDTQTVEILYKTGENCSVSESETIQRKFYVYWQCNTLAKPYANMQVTADVICTETLSIDSIYACPDFNECIFYDQNNMLNLTNLVGSYIWRQNPNNKSSWFYYSVCQNGLSNSMSLDEYYISQPTTLYNKFGNIGFMSGIYSGPQTVGQTNNFNVAGIASRFSANEAGTKYYYDQEINGWIFQYTNGNLCPMSLFTVQWNCGGVHPYSMVSYTETPCAVTVVIRTNLC